MRGIESIIAVHPDKYSSNLTLVKMHSPDVIRIMNLWKLKRVHANAHITMTEEASKIKFSTIATLCDMHGTLQSLSQIIMYRNIVKEALRKSNERNAL